jgi:hypothetical protein
MLAKKPAAKGKTLRRGKKLEARKPLSYQAYGSVQGSKQGPSPK